MNAYRGSDNVQAATSCTCQISSLLPISDLFWWKIAARLPQRNYRTKHFHRIEDNIKRLLYAVDGCD